MNRFSTITRYLFAIVMCMVLGSLSWVQAQEVELPDTVKKEMPKALMRRKRMAQQRHEENPRARRNVFLADSARLVSTPILPDETERADSIAQVNNENLEALEAPIDTLAVPAELTIDTLVDAEPAEKKLFVPDPAKATWMAVIFPGGGQIYNRKYWKLPIVYGGFVGCAYALTWNGQMYSDYSQAYLDIMDDNPETDSFLDFLPPGYDVNTNLDYLKKVIKRKKDSYRRYRDLSIFCFIGVYIVSIIDAYVDAELANFDISQDLSLKLEPAVMQNSRYNPQEGNAYGLQCSLRF